jgi:hypothetical protein
MSRWPRTDIKGSFHWSMSLANGVDVNVEVEYTITRAIPATYWSPAEGGDCEWNIVRVINAQVPDLREPPKYYELFLDASERAELLAMAQAEANHGQMYAACYDEAERVTS